MTTIARIGLKLFDGSPSLDQVKIKALFSEACNSIVQSAACGFGINAFLACASSVAYNLRNLRTDASITMLTLLLSSQIAHDEASRCGIGKGILEGSTLIIATDKVLDMLNLSQGTTDLIKMSILTLALFRKLLLLPQEPSPNYLPTFGEGESHTITPRIIARTDAINQLHWHAYIIEKLANQCFFITVGSYLLFKHYLNINMQKILPASIPAGIIMGVVGAIPAVSYIFNSIRATLRTTI